MSECNGQCYLNKQLDHASQNQDADLIEVRADFHIFTISENTFNSVNLIFEPYIIVQDFFLQKPYHTDIPDLDKPPKS